MTRIRALRVKNICRARSKTAIMPVKKPAGQLSSKRATLKVTVNKVSRRPIKISKMVFGGKRKTNVPNNVQEIRLPITAGQCGRVLGTG